MATEPKSADRSASSAASRCARLTGFPIPSVTARCGTRGRCGSRQLPVLHHPDRLRRSRVRPIALVDDCGRDTGHPDRDRLHGVPRGSGSDLRAPADDPVPGGFGFRGVVVALFAALHLLAFNIADQVLLAEGLHGAFGWNANAVAIVATVGAALLAIYGYDWLHRMFRWLLYILLPLIAIITVGVITGHAGGAAHTGIGSTGPGSSLSCPLQRPTTSPTRARVGLLPLPAAEDAL